MRLSRRKTSTTLVLGVLSAALVTLALVNIAGLGSFVSPPPQHHEKASKKVQPPPRTEEDHVTERYSPPPPFSRPTRATATQGSNSSTSLSTAATLPHPPLSALVQGWNITGDVSWLLDFAIIGFPKTGTSTLMFQLQQHHKPSPSSSSSSSSLSSSSSSPREVYMFEDERCEMGYNQQVRLIEDLYRKFPPDRPGQALLRGIKCPSDLENTRLSLRNYNKFFPRTDFIVGLRHPVLWFESFYNFRLQNHFPMPPAEQLIGKCRRGFWNVCTFRANFHIFLANLGHHHIDDQDATTEPYVAAEYRHALDPVPPAAHSTRRVFLYEIAQLSDPDWEAQFRRDLSTFLRLRHPLDRPLMWYKPGRPAASSSAENRTARLDICQPRYQALRKVLMEQAVNASKWIREFFISAPRVVVSSPDHLVNSLLPAWETDPCSTRSTTNLYP